MIDCAILLLAIAGFGLLLAAFPRHQHDWLGRRLDRGMSRLLRTAGFLLLALAYLIAGVFLGWGYGAVAWLGWLTFATILVVAAHTGRERILARVRR